MNANPHTRPQLRLGTAPLLIAALWLASCFSLPAAESPFYIPFQGKITDPTGQSVADGTYDLIFSLYDVRVGGQPLWTERHAQVGAVNGQINVFLGSIPENPVLLGTLDFATEKWLGITVDTDASAQPEMVPRQLLAPAFYAMRARDADQLQGHDWSVLFANGDPTGSIAGDRIAAGSIGNTQLTPGLVTSQLRDEGFDMQLSSARVSENLQKLGYAREPGYLDVGGNQFYAYRMVSDPVYRFALMPPLGSELMHNQSLDFGVMTESSRDLTLTLFNLGNRVLTGLSATIDGGNATDFSASIQNANVPIAGSTTILLTFSPSVFGQSSAVLHVSATDMADPFDLHLQGTVAIPEGFAAIPAGPFTMGRIVEDTDANAPPITVTVSFFAIQKEEVSWQQWQNVRDWAILAENGYAMNPAVGKAGEHPVTYLNWFDAVKWCNARSEMEGLTPCYYTDTDQTQIYKTGNVNILNTMVKWDANGYRLPTEAEWEKAARGGLSGTRFSWGQHWFDPNFISFDTANYNSDGMTPQYDNNSGGGHHPHYVDGMMPYTNPVLDFEISANSYGLKNMSGNVREWCWDIYAADYYATSNGTTDPRGPDSSSSRVLRGGDWNSNAAKARCSNRDYKSPGQLTLPPTEGFRPVRARR